MISSFSIQLHAQIVVNEMASLHGVIKHKMLRLGGFRSRHRFAFSVGHTRLSTKSSNDTFDE